MKVLHITPKQLKLGELGKELSTMPAHVVIAHGVAHILALPHRSALDGTCVYKGDGVCCAAAPFIKEYVSSMEENDWESLLGHFKQPKRNRVSINVLQEIHDGKAFWRLSMEEKVVFINDALSHLNVSIALA
jgi:hypothetical protein